MTLRKKILFLLCLNFLIISLFLFSNIYFFHTLQEHIYYLETTDNLISKVLQMRRYEKNIFLRWDQQNKDSKKEMQRYINEIQIALESLKKKKKFNNPKLKDLERNFQQYVETFKELEEKAKILEEKINEKFKKRSEPYPLLISAFLAHPIDTMKFLQSYHLLTKDEEIIFIELDKNLQNLRHFGEQIILLTKELDNISRLNIERKVKFLKLLQTFLFIFFLLFGIISTSLLSKSVFARLNILNQLIEDTGKGKFQKYQLYKISDELDLILYKFNIMEEKLKERDALLEKQREELYHSRKMATIGRLISKITHELNNPINNLYLTAQFIEKACSGEIDKEVIKESLKDLQFQIRRIKQILDNFLLFSKKGSLKKTFVNLQEFIQKTWENFIKDYPDAKINFKIVSEDLAMAKIDPLLFERVFINLFKNSLEAMDKEGEIEVKILKDKEKIKIEITDTGHGIPKEIAEHLFEPFVSTKNHGTGLGLSIVKDIVQKHKGEIILKETSSSGTTFLIILPAKDE